MFAGIVVEHLVVTELAKCAGHHPCSSPRWLSLRAPDLSRARQFCVATPNSPPSWAGLRAFAGIVVELTTLLVAERAKVASS